MTRAAVYKEFNVKYSFLKKNNTQINNLWKPTYLQLESNAGKCTRTPPAGHSASPTGNATMGPSVIYGGEPERLRDKSQTAQSQQWTWETKASPGGHAHHIGTGTCKRHILGVELQAADRSCVFTV